MPQYHDDHLAIDQVTGRTLSDVSFLDTIGAVRALADTATPAQVVSALYTGVSPDYTPAIQEQLGLVLNRLAAVTPNNQGAVLRGIDQSDLHDVETLICLHAALRKLYQPNQWIHHRAASVLDRMNSLGIADAAPPCIVHCLIVIGAVDSTSPAAHEPREILGRLLSLVAPREGLRFALTSLLSGNNRSFRSIVDATRILMPGSISISSLRSIDVIARLARLVGVDGPSDVNIVPATQAERTETICFTPPSTATFEPPLGDRHHHIFSGSEKGLTRPRIDIFVLRDGTVSVDLSRPESPQIYTFDAAHRCINELSKGYAPFIDPEPIHVKGALALLDDGSPKQNVSHLLLDKLSRVAAYEATSIHPDRFLLFMQSTYLSDAAAKLGIGRRLMSVNRERFSVKSEVLMISSNIFADYRHPAHFCAPWAMDYLGKLREPGSKPVDDIRLFVSRDDVKTRTVSNWEEVRPILDKHRFSIVQLSALSFTEQAKLFRSSTCIVGVHGAGLTNVLFAPGTCKVIEILPPLSTMWTYWMLCSALGLPYRALAGADPEYSTATLRTHPSAFKSNKRNVIVDPSKLDDALAWATA